MIDYRWRCLACGTGNNPENEYCSDCGCPANADGGVIEGWKRALTELPKKPSNVGCYGVLCAQNARTSPCPNCGLHMYISDSICPHCTFELSLKQRYHLIDNFKETQFYGYRLGLKFFLAIFLITIIIAYVAKNF
jgi:ribosomal protein L37E